MNNEERAKRLAAMKEEKQRQLKKRAMIKKYGPFAAGGFCVLLVAGVLIINGVSSKNKVNAGLSAGTANTVEDTSSESDNSVINNEENNDGYHTTLNIVNDSNVKNEDESKTEENKPTVPTTVKIDDVTAVYGYEMEYTDATITMEDEFPQSEFGILINLETGEVVAKKASLEQMYPASMTKVLTVLVAAEHIDMDKLDEAYSITQEATDYSFKYGCSNVGFAVDETVTIRDLFYGTILPSGGDAAYSLSTYVAGSQEAFADMMNEKIKELGLEETTHFTNSVGLYDKEHFTTAYDMAMITKAAIENDFVREVMTAHTYTTTATKEHPEGITISNWFLRRIEDRESGGEVISAKTGFVNQSGCCATSYFKSESGVPYICVTGNAYSSWRAIDDHAYIYKTYSK